MTKAARMRMMRFAFLSRCDIFERIILSPAW
jgi:hypothetical protein